MTSCERPMKRSARDALPLSVSKRYSLSTLTHGSFCRHCASSSLRRVSSFSALSSSSRAASHSSRVPVLWSVIVLSTYLIYNKLFVVIIDQVVSYATNTRSRTAIEFYSRHTHCDL